VLNHVSDVPVKLEDGNSCAGLAEEFV